MDAEQFESNLTSLTDKIIVIKEQIEQEPTKPQLSFNEAIEHQTAAATAGFISIVPKL